MVKSLNPATHLARHQRRMGVVVLRDCAINDPIVARLKNQTDALSRQLAKRSVDGSVKRIKHRWGSPARWNKGRSAMLRGVNGDLRYPTDFVWLGLRRFATGKGQTTDPVSTL